MAMIINIRGCNASGKTTAVKGYISRFSNIQVQEVKTQNFKTKITLINSGEIVVVGKYDDRKCCGCDADLKNRENLIEILIYILKKIKPQIIIYEGLIYGKTYRLFTDVFRLATMFKYDCRGIYLHRELTDCIKLLEARNEGANYNVATVVSVHQSCVSSYNKLKKAGYKIKKVDVEAFKKEDMYKIIEGVINDGL